MSVESIAQVMGRITPDELEQVAADLERATAEEVLEWAVGTLHPQLALASSFGAEDVVLIDMLERVRPGVRVITLDTGRLHPETYDVMDEVRRRYNRGIEIFFPQADAVEAMVNSQGLNLFYNGVEQRKLCCGIRKIEPLRRALQGLAGWITGLRREQAPTRARISPVEVDVDHGGILKINPLAEWTWAQVWDYVQTHRLPYNALHDRGYLSIGCAPCTRAVGPGEDPRAGRWWWEQRGDKECGLHLAHGDSDGARPAPPTPLASLSVDGGPGIDRTP